MGGSGWGSLSRKKLGNRIISRRGRFGAFFWKKKFWGDSGGAFWLGSGGGYNFGEMLTDDQLLELLRGGESDRAEFTRSWQDPDKIGRALCAFANDLPGHGLPGAVFVGVDDDGKPAGLPITDLLLRRLGEFSVSGNILPLPTLAVRKWTLDGAEVAVVAVRPHPRPPVRYKGECCVRVGPRHRRAAPLEETALAEKARDGDLPFDQRPARPPAVLDDLEMGNFRDYLRRAVSAETLAENMRDEEHQLQSLGFAGRNGEIRNGALMCFARDLHLQIPGAYIQFARFPGTGMSDRPKIQRELRGTVFQQLRLAEDAIDGNITVPAIIGKKTRTDYPDYPVAALRQLITNAVLHRSYEGELANSPAHFYWFDDHVEIRSPGGLFGGMPKSDFGKPGVIGYRNPKLAEALKTMDFVERYGFGIYKARNALAENCNPPPEFQLDANRVTVVLRKAEWTARAAELACCQALFRFKSECESGPAVIAIPGIPPLGDEPGYVSVVEESGITGVAPKDAAIRAVARFTGRKAFSRDRWPMTPPKEGEFGSAYVDVSPRVNTARIMRALIGLFGAEESELRETLAESFLCYTPSEKEARENDNCGFSRLQESELSLAEMEADIARETNEPKMRALVDMEKEVGTRTPNGITVIQVLDDMTMRNDDGTMGTAKAGQIFKGEEIIRRFSTLQDVARIVMEKRPRMKVLEYNGQKVAEPDGFPESEE